jgi:hypothetical protein
MGEFFSLGERMGGRHDTQHKGLNATFSIMTLSI